MTINERLEVIETEIDSLCAAGVKDLATSHKIGLLLAEHECLVNGITYGGKNPNEQEG